MGTLNRLATQIARVWPLTIASRPGTGDLAGLTVNSVVERTVGHALMELENHRKEPTKIMVRLITSSIKFRHTATDDLPPLR